MTPEEAKQKQADLRKKMVSIHTMHAFTHTSPDKELDLKAEIARLEAAGEWLPSVKAMKNVMSRQQEEQKKQMAENKKLQALSIHL